MKKENPLIELVNKNIGRKANIFNGKHWSHFVTLHQCHVRGIECGYLKAVVLCSDADQMQWDIMRRNDKKKGQARP